ncbi:MAG: PAS domain-containing protein [Variovorax sp.]|nr:PAS domain-containing protein [Variovorax sp.]
MQPPGQPSTRHEFVHADGTRRAVYCVDHEMPFPDGHLIVSRTDLRGHLTHANDAFVTMSGYEREELIGMPHCILRHPDMPRAAFKDLWETLKAGRKWHGYVKNLRKDGLYYWVYATAVPNIRGGEVVGYTSVRRKPSRTQVDAVAATYRQWLAEEQRAP